MPAPVLPLLHRFPFPHLCQLLPLLPQDLCDAVIVALASVLDRHPELSLELYGDARREAPDSSPLCQVGHTRLSRGATASLQLRLLAFSAVSSA